MKNLKVGLLGLSDPVSVPHDLVHTLKQAGIQVEVSPLLDKMCTPSDRAQIWNAWMESGQFDWIFDVSGGNLSTLTLPFLHLESYMKVKTVFAGYSDITPILNALWTAGKGSVLFSARQNIGELVEYLLCGDESLFDCGVDGVVLGGNLRCLLKLAGTEYWPELDGEVLLLEANSGTITQLQSMTAQLVNMGMFDEIQTLVLGQFSQAGNDVGRAVIIDTLRSMNAKLPKIMFTDWIGHAPGSRAVWIGEKL